MEVLRINLTTLRANTLGLQQLPTDTAEFRIIRKFNLTFRALHQHCPPTKLQSMTARQECQALHMRVLVVWFSGQARERLKILKKVPPFLMDGSPCIEGELSRICRKRASSLACRRNRVSQLELLSIGPLPAQAISLRLQSQNSLGYQFAYSPLA